MSSIKDIFGSSSELDKVFEGLKLTGMTKIRKTSSGKQSHKQSRAGNSREQDQTKPRPGPGRPSLQDGGYANGFTDRLISVTLEGSDHALLPTDIDRTPQMRKTPSPNANDIPTRFVCLKNLAEMIAMHMGLLKPEDPATTPEDPSAASESATPIGVV